MPSSPCHLSAQDWHRLPEENMGLCGLLSVNRQWQREGKTGQTGILYSLMVSTCWNGLLGGIR